MGALCCVCFTASGLASLAGPQIDYTLVQRKDNQSVTVDRASVEEVKACRLEVATMRRCAPCKLLKETTIPALQEAGYEVTVVDRKDDKRDTELFPTLYYIGRLGQVTRTEVGYKTYKHVIKHLEKP